MVCSQELETQKGKFNLEDNKLERHETIKRMKFDEHLTGGSMLYKEIKRRYHDDKGDINRKDGKCIVSISSFMIPVFHWFKHFVFLCLSLDK